VYAVGWLGVIRWALLLQDSINDKKRVCIQQLLVSARENEPLFHRSPAGLVQNPWSHISCNVAVSEAF